MLGAFVIVLYACLDEFLIKHSQVMLLLTCSSVRNILIAHERSFEAIIVNVCLFVLNDNLLLKPKRMNFSVGF